ncbi:MAG: SufD family Fe-S cluster assembly protein [Alphaproteobacteria bacterium]|nr:SufD family Fe-S cluster assembly protein [Alphaproteobacteria bacterium]
MSYIWNKFNIKTFPAETIVYCDGEYNPDLSTIRPCDISKKYDLPIHIIYTGKIAGEKNIDLNITAENQRVFLSVDIKNKFPAFFNIFIKNTGKNSEIRSHILLTNYSELIFKCNAEHHAENTGILVQTKILGMKNSFSQLSGLAVLDKNTTDSVSDIRFSGLLDKTARVTFVPKQKIKSVPHNAEHSAYTFHGTDEQIEYLCSAGLSNDQAENALKEAFVKDFNLY